MVEITIDSACTITGATADQITQIKKALTLVNPQFTEALKMGRYTGKLDRYLHYFKETDAGLEVPRGFTGPAIDIIGPCKIVDHRRAMDPLQLEFAGELRPYQQAAVEDVSRFDFALLEAGTGSGKTIMALALIAERQRPTLVVVHSKELLYQWRDRIKQFLNVEPGLIGDSKFDVQQITIGIVNSVSIHLSDLKELFGFLVVDECHRCPATMFKKVVGAFDCKYQLGLSATPYRRDGLTPVINFFLGRTVHKVDKNHLNEIGAVLRPEIRQVETDFEYHYADDYSKMLTALVEDVPRNTQIVNESLRHSDKGTVLIVSDRVEHCLMLAARLHERGQEPAILTGKTPKKIRLKIVDSVRAGKVKFLISTLSLISEGFDCSNLSTLVLTTPISFKGRITQAVGRILRPSGPNKKPRVTDFADNQVGVLRAGTKKRLKILKSR